MASFDRDNSNHINKLPQHDSPMNKSMMQGINIKQGRTFNILIGCTGSVASLKIPKLVEELLASKFKVL